MKHLCAFLLLLILASVWYPTYAFNGFSTQPVTPWRDSPTNQTWNTPKPSLYQQQQGYRQQQLNQGMQRDLDRREVERYSSPPVRFGSY